jgi:predicted metalloprotease with PDZ domain
MYSIEQRDEQVLNTNANIRYHFHFELARRHCLRIVMEIDAPEDGELVIGLPAWIPGSYKIRDYISMVGSFSLTDANGNVPRSEWISKNRLRLWARRGVLRIEYIYYAYERDSAIRSSHVTLRHAFINPASCCLYVEGREREIHHLYLHYDRKQWTKISTSLSPVNAENAPSSKNLSAPVILGALNYDILVDSPMEIGNHFTAAFDYNGSRVETAILYRGNFNPAWLHDRIQTIVETEAALFGGLPFDRYVFIIHLLPGMRGGGLEHARSSVNAVDSWGDAAKMNRLLSLLVHEFFHVWNIKRIRPFELGPFDYNRENYTRMLWLVEGATSYMDDLLTYRCGFYTRADYLRILSQDHLTPFFRTPGRNQASIKDNSFQAWVKLYLPHDDSNNRNVSYYLHGGLVFLCLDLWIIAESNGEKRLDDVFRALWALYLERPREGVTEEEFIEIAERATGVEIRARFLAWLSGKGDDLPFGELFSRFGLEWRAKPAAEIPAFGEQTPGMPVLPKMFTGMTLKMESGKLLAAQIEEGSPADEAGLGVDDEVIFVNGARCSSSEEFDVLLAQRGAGVPSELLVSSDFSVRRCEIRPTLLQEYALVEQENASEEQRRLLERWLERKVF